MTARTASLAFASSLALFLASCGGGGSAPVPAGGGGSTPLSAAAPGALSSGAITAFGSVFVNGLEYSTSAATVVDDDTGATSPSTTDLEVGQVVDVKAAASSTPTTPVAGELHVHPLARGYLDGVDPLDSTLVVMGQTVEVGASTNFSDHRACVAAATSPCAAITGLSGLTATAGSGAAAVAGHYVTVDGYLFGSGADPAATHIVATLVSISDAPTAGYGAAFKAEGLVSSTTDAGIVIGGLSVDLSTAVCYAGRSVTPCAGAFATGQIVSAFAAAAPALPATTLVADAAVQRPSRLASTAGATVAVEGSVSSVTASPAGFVIRGIAIDASGLPAGTTLPAVGDIVRVLGTVESTGSAISASRVVLLRHALSATFGFAGDIAAVTPTGTDTYTASVLGKTVTINAATRLADWSTRHWNYRNASNPFNSATFQSYLAASASQHVFAQTWLDDSGKLQVISLTIVPASTVSAVAGAVDATPAPVNSTATGTPTTFAVKGVAVGADPTAIRGPHRAPATAGIAAGDEVTVFGQWSAASQTLGVAANATRDNIVIDFGALRQPGHDGF